MPVCVCYSQHVKGNYMKTEPKLLTLREAVSMLRICTRSYYRLVQRKVLPRPIKVGSKTLVPESDVRAYIDGLIERRDKASA